MAKTVAKSRYAFKVSTYGNTIDRIEILEGFQSPHYYMLASGSKINKHTPDYQIFLTYDDAYEGVCNNIKLRINSVELEVRRRKETLQMFLDKPRGIVDYINGIPNVPQTKPME